MASNKEYTAPPFTPTCAEREHHDEIAWRATTSIRHRLNMDHACIKMKREEEPMQTEDGVQCMDGQHEIHHTGDSTRKQQPLTMPSRSTFSMPTKSCTNNDGGDDQTIFPSTGHEINNKEFQGHGQFSLFEDRDHTLRYSVYRPKYPKRMYEEHVFTKSVSSMHAHVNRVMNENCDHEESQTQPSPNIDSLLKTVKHWIALDVGCGSGQATFDLSLYCKYVIGVDPSQNQISIARRHLKESHHAWNNVEFEVGVAENLESLARKYKYLIEGNEQTNHVDEASKENVNDENLEIFDLIVSSSSLHWFDFEKFFHSVDRVLKKGGNLVSWCYGLPNFESELAQQSLLEFYHCEALKGCWTERRFHIDTEYKYIPHIPYPQNKEYVVHTISQTLTLDQFIGYIGTWSALNIYIEKHGKEKCKELLNDFRTKLRHALCKDNESGEEDSIRFEIHLPVWIIKTWKPYF